MSLRVTFVAAARSSSLLAERFQDDRPLDQAGWDEVQSVAHGLLPLAAAELRYCSPTARCTSSQPAWSSGRSSSKRSASSAELRAAATNVTRSGMR